MTRRLTRRSNRRSARALLTLALAGAVVVTAPGAAVAAPGDFDPSFGTAGVATAPASASLPATGANSLAIDPSGRIVAAGSTYDTATSQYVFTVHRFLPTGAIDAGFGTNGLAIVPITSGWTINQVTGVGIQPDGRIVVGARVYPTATPDSGKYGVVRLTPGGILDLDFDGGVAADGILMLTVGPPAGSDVERRLAVDETGRILISGGTYYTGPAQARATMARLNVDGTFDETFSGDGKFDLLMPTSGSDLKALADLPGANGYALGGYTIPNTGPTTGQPTIVRISEGGELVTGFTSSLSNTPGMATTYWQGDPTQFAEITTLAGLPNGGLVAGGYQNLGRAGLAKYTPTGGLDPSFGVGGVTLLQLGGGASSVNNLVLQADGKILAAMYGTDATEGFVARFTAAGVLDPTFGQGGTVEVNPTGGTDELALQADGKVVAVAQRGQPYTTLVRLLGDPAPPAPETAPSVQVTSPAGKTVKAKKLKALAGTAGPTESVALVRVALQRVDKPLLKEKKRCLWLANHRAKFKKVKATQKKCSRPLYRKATGTSSWNYALRNQLGKGKYVLYAQVRLDDERTATVRTRFRVT
jgi:uncharacterized delta-60 repeat protein